MVLRNVAKTFSLEEQRQEINEIAVDLDAVNTTLTNWNAANWDAAYGWGDHAQAGYLTSYTETDPVFGASAASGIAAGDITNWNSAYGWGDHSTEGYLVNGTLSATIYRGSGEFRIIAGGSQTTRPHIHLKNSTTTDLDILGASSAAGGVTIDSRGSGTVKLKDGGNTRLETSDNGVTITGEISVSGNVDGRDLAADGTKLDGIETGATADQTGAEIKTAYEGEADTNAFTDAEQTKLAGIADGAEVNLDPGGTYSGAGTTADPAIGSIQFKNTGNTFGGDSLFTYDNTNNKLSVGVSSGSSALNVVRPGATSVDTAYFYASTSGSDNRILINTVANQGGNPFIRFDSGGSNMVIGQLWAGTTSNKLVLGTGETPSSVTGITIDGLGNVTANNLALSQTNTSATGASATSTVLDHYEEGTFTPIASAGYTSPTYDIQEGYYTRTGNLLYVTGVLRLTGGTGTGSGVQIGGMPFPSANPIGHGDAMVSVSGATNTAVNQFIFGTISSNTTTIDLYHQTTTAIQVVSGSNLGNSVIIRFSGTWRV